MKSEKIDASAQAIEKAKEMQKKMIDLFNQLNGEHKSIQDLIRTDLQATGKWDNEQIEVIISNLQKGITSYRTQRNSVNEGYEALSLEQLEETLRSVPEEQHKNKLIAALSILTFIKDTGSDLTELRNKWEMMDEAALKDLVVGYANKNETYNNVIEQLKEGIEDLNLSELDIPKQFGEMSEDYKLYVATQIFIEADDLSMQNLESQAQAIGASSAAAVDIAYETARLQNGEISEATWHSVVKGILAVLAVCALSLVLLFTTIDLLMNIVLLFTAIFGFSALSIFIAMILGYAFAAGFIYLLYRGFEELDGDIIEEIDSAVEKCLCKIDEWIEKIKAKVLDIWDRFREKMSSPEKPVVEDGPITNTGDDNRVGVQPNRNPTTVPA